MRSCAANGFEMKGFSLKHKLTALFLTLILTIGLISPCSAQSAAERPDAAETPALQFTQEEQDYIASHPTLRIGFVQDRIPVSFTGKNGELAGISRYTFDRIAQLSGLNFEYIPLPSGAVTYEYLIENHLDLVTGVEYNKENMGARGILISEPYLSSKKVIVARKDRNFNISDNQLVAISSGSQTIEKALHSTFPNFAIENYDTIADCFTAVSSGKADLLIQNQYVVEYWISKPAYEDLKVMPILGLDDQLCFSAVVAFDERDAPSNEEGQVLIGILNKAIESISEDEMDNYTIQAVMENPYTFTLSDFLYRYRYTVIVLSGAVLIIIVLVVMLMRLRIRSLAEKADVKARGQFLSTMSHEIRTPLNGLIGLNQLMLQRLDDRQRLEDCLRKSTFTAKYLLSLVNDILDMSYIQQKNMAIAHKPVDLELLISTINSIFRGNMEEKNIDFRTSADLPWPCVSGDEVRIQQVLMNLLDNAYKFTQPGGHVTLSVSQQMDEDGKVTTRAEVADTGKGISEEFRAHIFDSFAQDLDTVSKGNQGAGLGLSISYSLAKLMDGDLTFTSQKGRGSQFVFTFRCAPDALPDKKPSAPPKANTDEKVLVAEDNELNAEIITELLRNEGFNVVLAKNGLEALHIFEASPVGDFRTVIMDLLMPEMNGFQATEAIRSLKREDAKTVKIIACSANAVEPEREKALACGMDDFIAKPVDIVKLLEKMK